MNINEALTEIESRNKPYLDAGIPQATFANTIKAIKWGTAKEGTISAFMAKMGYVKEPDNWKLKIYPHETNNN